MAVAFVQGNSAQSFSASSAPAVTVSAIGSGRSICGIVSGSVGSGQTLTSVTDNNANSYNILDSSLNTGAGGFASYTFTGGNITGGPTTFTANWSAAIGNWGIAVDEFSGTLASTNPIDNSGASHIAQFQTAASTAANNATSTPVTTVNNGCGIWGASVDHSGASNNATAGTGFTVRQTMTIRGITESQIQGTAGSIAATATLSAAQDQFTAIIALQPAGAAVAATASISNLMTMGVG